MVSGMGFFHLSCHVFCIMTHSMSGWLVVRVGISPTGKECITRVNGAISAVRCEFSRVRGKEGCSRDVMRPLAMGARQG